MKLRNTLLKVSARYC